MDSSISSGMYKILGIPRLSEPYKIPSSSSSSPTSPTDLTISKGTNPDSSSSHIQSCRKIMDTISNNAERRSSQVHLFSLTSWSYAPPNLRHLKQPIPNDLPSRRDATIFTFEDAFEDLLAVSQGNSLPDINTRLGQRKLLGQMYPNGEPMWFWLRRLESQGLLRRPGLDEMHKLKNFGSLSNRQNEYELFQSHWPNREGFENQLERQVTDVRRRGDEADNRQGTGDFFDEVHRAFRSLEDDFAKRISTHTQEPYSKHHARHGGFPDNFDDLFSSVTSGFADGQGTWDTFVRSILENKSLSTCNNHRETKQDKSGNKDIVSQDEYVDCFGYLHTTVTRKTLDKEGKEIGSQTHFTMRPVDKKPNKTQGQDGNDANAIERREPEHSRQTSDSEKQGWFWK